ncbi:SpaH/EbpB family LPXTG-anchored major pilin [Microbacterium sp. 2C]|uniref:SpaH/EbpB family LPXTG-anchored major pilin n=1 Tax=Microbacterium paulum TaxID=2707006 RepID=UPI0018C345E3|nr:SpaH/EbpB family LPXTG-anchored major pilin [Microbacterium paulum]MBG0718425.1 SpaH/EbpB family LPXTG-anchored major pilin [Microbacterium paulum]
MKTTKRGFLATIGTVAAAAALVLTGSVAAHAAPPLPVPVQSTVTITKLSQPNTLTAPANGTQVTTLPAGSAPIAGVTFDYYLVTGTAAGQANDIGTQTGQAYAAGLNATSAPVPTTKTGSFGQTKDDGTTTLTLPRGLYLIKESGAPTGVTPAANFLLAVPLTDPVNQNAWLDTIYVYPKNAQIKATKTVGSETLTVGGDATFTITTDIPRNPNPAGSPAFVAPSAFRIQDTLTDSQLKLSTTAAAALTVTAGGTTLTGGGADYTVTAVTGTNPATTTQRIEFTSTGLSKLATAVNANPGAQVVVKLVATVQSAAVITNTASVFPDQGSITSNTPLVTTPVQMKYGTYLLNKKSTGGAGVSLAGAQFRVYATQADAAAANGNYLTTSTNTAGLWTTDANGQVSVGGLRYSGWVNGAAVASGTAGYQTYYLVEVKALTGHQLLTAPVAFTVDDNSATQMSQTIVNQQTTGGFVLPLTGGSGVVVFTVFGVGILAAVLIVARLRRREAAE